MRHYNRYMDTVLPAFSSLYKALFLIVSGIREAFTRVVAELERIIRGDSPPDTGQPRTGRRAYLPAYIPR
jgi:hypothetical protein